MAIGATNNNSAVAASELTAEQVQKILVKPLEAASTFLAAGPKVYDTTGPLRLPKAPTSHADDLEFVGENEQIDDIDPEFDEVTLLPSTMKSIKTLTRYSNELARQSVVSLDAALKERLVADVAARIDAQFWGATGDGITTPKGLFAWTGTQTVDLDGDPLNLDALLDAWGKALAANVNMASLKWAITPGDFVALRKIKDTQNRYLLQADPTADGVFRLWGAPVIITGRIPNKVVPGVDPAPDVTTGRAALIDFGQIAVARDSAPSVKILDQTFGDYDQQAIRVTARYDLAPLNPEAVVVLTNVNRD